MLEHNEKEIADSFDKDSIVETITTASGKVVSLDEFLCWSAHRQNVSMFPRKNFGKRRDGFAKEQSERIKAWWDERRKHGPIAAVNRGISHSEETKHKIGLKSSERLKGVPKSEAHKAAIRKASANRKKTLKEIVTPFGNFQNAEDAAKSIGIAMSTLKRRFSVSPEKYYRVYTD
jgi:hypothetical protein